MANKAQIVGQIVKAALRKYPKHPTSTLAKMIAAKHKELFTYDSARTNIRYYRGANGSENRSKLADKEFVREKRTSSPDDYLSFIPESSTIHRERWNLPKSIKNVALWGDMHIPYHDEKALKAAVKLAKAEKVDAIYINGDLLDFFGLSFHEKNPTNRPKISEELESARTFLKGLRKAFDGIPIYYCPANHEARLERYLALKAPELLDCSEFRLDVLLRLAEYGISYIPAKTKVYFGKLLVEHGDRLKGTGGVNPARTARLKYKRSTIVNHFHKLSSDSGKAYDGDVMTCWSNGCLCELEPEYMEVNEHVHGVCHIKVDIDGSFVVRQFQIIDGKVY